LALANRVDGQCVLLFLFCEGVACAASGWVGLTRRKPTWGYQGRGAASSTPFFIFEQKGGEKL